MRFRAILAAFAGCLAVAVAIPATATAAPQDFQPGLYTITSVGAQVPIGTLPVPIPFRQVIASPPGPALWQVTSLDNGLTVLSNEGYNARDAGGRIAATVVERGQEWRINPVGNGQYTIELPFIPEVWTISGGDPGAPVWLRPMSGDPNQLWTLTLVDPD